MKTARQKHLQSFQPIRASGLKLRASANRSPTRTASDFASILLQEKTRGRHALGPLVSLQMNVCKATDPETAASARNRCSSPSHSVWQLKRPQSLQVQLHRLCGCSATLLRLQRVESQDKKTTRELLRNVSA